MIKKKVHITALDGILIVVLLATATYMVYRVTMAMNYHWNWAILPKYFFYYDEEKGRWVANILIEGLLTTIRLSIWATLLAILLGTTVGIMRTSRRLLFRLISRTYVELIRNIPPLVLVFIFYFFVSDQIMPLLGIEAYMRGRSPFTQGIVAALMAPTASLNTFLSGTMTVALFQGAYITEIVRAGIQSIEKGQWEAAYALGLSWWSQMRWVILPRAIRRVLPALTNEFINTIKYSAIVSVISIQELTFQGMQIMAATYLTMEVWLIITAIYLVMCLLLSMGVRRLEHRLARSQGSI